MRGNWIALATTVWALGLGTGSADAWDHCQCKYSNGSTSCTSVLPNTSCMVACSANTSPGVKIISAVRGHGECPYTCQTGTQQTLTGHVKYSIGHQGASVWVGSGGNVRRSGEDLRAVLVATQTGQGNEQGFCEIANAQIGNLEEATANAVQQCKIEPPGSEFPTHLGWACRQGVFIVTARLMKGLIAQGNYDGVRQLYHTAERHDDRLKNIASCYKGDDIRDIFGAVCGPADIPLAPFVPPPG